MRFRLRTLLIIVTVVCGLLGLWKSWEFLPGTFYFDQSGFPHGTGTERTYYQSGALKSETRYFGGVPTRGTWYQPDGTILGDYLIDKQSVSTGYGLREDGSIRWAAQYKWSEKKRFHLAHGWFTYFNADGSVEKVLHYEDGVPVEKK